MDVRLRAGQPTAAAEDVVDGGENHRQRAKAAAETDRDPRVRQQVQHLPDCILWISRKIKCFSSNEEEEHTESDNMVTFTIPVDFRNQLTLNGRSNPEQVGDFVGRRERRALLESFCRLEEPVYS